MGARSLFQWADDMARREKGNAGRREQENVNESTENVIMSECWEARPLEKMVEWKKQRMKIEKEVFREGKTLLGLYEGHKTMSKKNAQHPRVVKLYGMCIVQ